MRILLALALGLAATSLDNGPVPDAPAFVVPAAGFGAAELVGRIEKKSLNEASGMAASRHASDILWLVNDSGHKAKLYAATTSGDHRGTVALPEARNQDWEDMAAFSLDGQDYLLIADTGDNKARHPFSSLYIVPEPQPDENGSYDGKVSLAWTIHFQYEDGPRDCESVAVDVQNEEVLLLSKRTDPPALYMLPLRPAAAALARGPAGIIVAKKLGAVTTIPRPSAAQIINDPVKGSYRAQPTGMDIAPSGNELVVMTYGDIYRYLREADMSWFEALQRAPVILRKPDSGQTEALAYSADEQAIYYTAEDRNPPMYRYRREL